MARAAQEPGPCGLHFQRAIVKGCLQGIGVGLACLQATLALWALQHAGNGAEAAGADSSSRGPLIIFTKLRPPQSICTGMYCFRLGVELGVAGATEASGPSCMVRLVVAVHGQAELLSDGTVLDGLRP
jgi:hypothetical protein